MVTADERELLREQLVAYLEDLQETGVEELCFAPPRTEKTLLTAPEREPSRQELSAPAPRLEAVPAEARPIPAARAAEPVRPAAEPVRPAATAASAPPASPKSAPRLFRGFGNPQARLVLVLSGEGFRGESGDLLQNIIKAIGFEREEVCLLCFPAAAATAAGLRDQLLAAIGKVAPEVVVAFGEEAAHVLLQTAAPIAAVRGSFRDLEGIPLMPTLHPDQLLADETGKRPVWGDLQQVMRRLG